MRRFCRIKVTNMVLLAVLLVFCAIPSSALKQVDPFIAGSAFVGYGCIPSILLSASQPEILNPIIFPASVNVIYFVSCLDRPVMHLPHNSMHQG